MTRENGIQGRPAQVFQTLADNYRIRLVKPERAIRHSLELYAKNNDWKIARGLAKEAGEWSALAEITSWLDEAVDVVDPQADAATVEEALLALRERALFFRLQAPWSVIRERFRSFEAHFGLSFSGIRFQTAEYNDYFHAPIDVFAEYFSHGEFAVFAWHCEVVISALRADDEYQLEVKTLELVNMRHARMADEMSEEQLARVLEEINSIVTDRSSLSRSLGVISSPDFTILTWSNGGRRWVINARWDTVWMIRHFLEGKTELKLNLGPDDVIVPYPESVVQLVLTSIYDSPLYTDSFEGRRRRRARGSVAVSDKAAKSIMKALVVRMARGWAMQKYGLSEDEAIEKTPEDYALKAMGYDYLWNTLVQAKAEQDQALFESVMSETDADSTPAFRGRLEAWFGGVKA